jgi:hypothetical protein
VVVYRSLHQPNEKLVELMLLALQARAWGVQRLLLVAPYLAYMRQDIAFNPGEAISQRVVGAFLATLFDAVITVDPHLHRVATLEEAVAIFRDQRALHPMATASDYVFMPHYRNRKTAVNTYRRIFNHFLSAASVKTDKDGAERSPYSLRHYALQDRLLRSAGKVNIYWLAENAGTSVEQLERFYLKGLAPSAERVRNIQSGAGQ